MPRIEEYTAKTTKLTPSAEGTAAWETAGRRLGPAYNEAGRLIAEGAGMIAKAGQRNLASGEDVVRAGEREVKAGGFFSEAAQRNVQAGTLEEQAAARVAAQNDRLQQQAASQYEDLFKLGNEVAKVGSGGGGTGSPRGGSGGVNFGGGSSGRPRTSAPQYAAAAEINSGMNALTDGFSPVARNPAGHPGGKEINVAAGETSPNAPGFWTNDGKAGDPYKINGSTPFVPGSDQDFSSDRPMGGQVYFGPTGPNQGGNNQDASAPKPADSVPGSPGQQYFSPIGAMQNGQPMGSAPNAPPSSAGIDWSTVGNFLGIGQGEGMGNSDGGF